MGFHVEINSILRTDEPYLLKKGETFPFRKTGSRVFFDTLPIWLVTRDWTALAEILVVKQSRTPLATSGEFVVRHIYTPDEQAPMTAVFRRLYASGGDPFIYLLLAGEDYEKAAAAGSLVPPSLEKEGFVHAMAAGLINKVANKRFTNAADVRLLVVALDRIAPEVKWEPAGGDLYPHIYGPLNMDAVLKAVPVAKNAAGVFEIRPGDFTSQASASDANV
jgi:uncharacterized protein (DUF952 family)